MKVSAHGSATLLAAAVLLGLGACGAGGGDGTASPSGRPSAERSVTRPTDDATRTATAGPEESPRSTADRTGRPTRTDDAQPPAQPTAQPPPATTQPEPAAPTTAQPPPTQAQPPAQTQPPQPTRGQAAPPAQTTGQQTGQQTAPPASDVAATAESTGAGDVWCLLMILLVGLFVGGLVVWRGRHRSDWDVEAATLVGTTTDGLNRLTPVLTTTTIGERALVWPPLRDDLGTLIGSWDVLAGRAADETCRGWAIQIRSLLEDLVFAVDQENEVLAAGREWRLLRPRIAAVEQALAAALAAQPMIGAPVPSQAAGYGAGSSTYPGVRSGYPTTPAAYPPEPTDPPGSSGDATEQPGPPAYTSDPPGSPEPPAPPDTARHRA